MPKIESEVTIQAPLETVWELAQDVENLPDIMPDLVSVRVLEREEQTPTRMRTVTEWTGRIKQFNRTMQWTEEDIWDQDEHTCRFWQTQGDFSDYRGEWRFSEHNGGTLAYLVVEYSFEIPLLGAIIKKVVQKLMQDNSDGMLQALKAEAEQRASGQQ